MSALAALITLAAAAQAPVPALDAVALYRAACISGAVQLRKSEAVPVKFEDVPLGARQALAMSRFESGGKRSNAVEAPRRIANPVYKVASGPDIYLIVPADGSGPYQEMCAVLVQSNSLSRAQAIFKGSPSLALMRQEKTKVGYIGKTLPTFMAPDEPNYGWRDLGYVSDYSDGHLRVAVQVESWLSMSSAPDVIPCRLTLAQKKRDEEARRHRTGSRAIVGEGMACEK